MLMIFEKSTMMSILFFQKEAIFYQHVLKAVNIPSQFGKDILMNDQDIKSYVKTSRMDIHTYNHGSHFIIYRPQPSASRRIKRADDSLDYYFRKIIHAKVHFLIVM